MEEILASEILVFWIGGIFGVGWKGNLLFNFVYKEIFCQEQHTGKLKKKKNHESRKEWWWSSSNSREQKKESRKIFWYCWWFYGLFFYCQFIIHIFKWFQATKQRQQQTQWMNWKRNWFYFGTVFVDVTIFVCILSKQKTSQS